MFKFLKMKKLNKKGSGMATVIVAIALISILASTLMSVTFINYKMKVTNMNTKKTFYSAETALDEVNMGLQDIVSAAVTEAYLFVVSNYSQYDADEKNDKLENLYYDAIYRKLATDVMYDKYKLDVLNGYLKTQAWNATDGYGCIVTSSSNDMITYSKTGIVLKNVEIYCKDANGYTSSIVTDIRLACPSIDFGAVTSLPDILGFSIIADSNLDIKTSAGSTTTIVGDVYGGKIAVYADRADVNPAKAIFKGIVDSGVEQISTIISKRDMSIKNATASFGEFSELWTQTLLADTSDVTLNGTEYIGNDINLKGLNTKLKMTNKLYAYGSSLNEPDSSSAILINGQNTTVDFTGAQIVMIAGHAFVSTGSNNTGNVDGVASTAGDIYTGESIAVKSNQLMYLVPGECIGVSGGKSLYNQNPLTAEQYKRITSSPDIVEVSDEVTVERIGDTLAKYIKHTGYVDEEGHRQTDFETLFVQTNGSTMVYYYMLFENELAANEYFAAYYSNNVQRYTKYLKFYANAINVPDPTAMVRLQTAGNLLEYDGTNSSLLVNTVSDATTKLASTSALYAKQFKSLTIKLLKDYLDASNSLYTDPITNDIVFDNLIDSVTFKQACDEDITRIIRFGDIDVFTVAVNNEIGAPYEYNASISDYDKIHCIIATGDVRISTDFTGIIIANGKVTVDPGVTVTADKSYAQICLRLTDVGGNSVYQYFRDGSAISRSGGKSFGQMDISSLVVYENWSRH